LVIVIWKIGNCLEIVFWLLVIKLIKQVCLTK
jgi:hypothetical protein